MIKICKKCGKTEEEHCSGFEPLETPEGCVCEPQSWAFWCNGKYEYRFRPICHEFKPGPYGYCARCEHDKKCHDQTRGKEPTEPMERYCWADTY